MQLGNLLVQTASKYTPYLLHTLLDSLVTPNDLEILPRDHHHISLENKKVLSKIFTSSRGYPNWGTGVTTFIGCCESSKALRVHGDVGDEHSASSCDDEVVDFATSAVFS